MAITVQWVEKLVESTASITDLPALKDLLRAEEDTAEGILHDGILTYKKLDLGGGAFFHAVDFINGYVLKFPNAGAYVIDGNLGCEIVPVAGVFVDRTKAAAFATTAIGAEGVTPSQVWEDLEIEGGRTPKDVLKVLLDLAAGKSAGAGTGTRVFRDLADTKNVLVAELDQAGNRTSVTLDL